MVTTDAEPPALQLTDHEGRPFALRETIPAHEATVLYTFRGHW